jgi:hypothetical protein
MGLLQNLDALTIFKSMKDIENGGPRGILTAAADRPNAARFDPPIMSQWDALLGKWAVS